MSLIRIAGYPMDLAVSEEHSFPGEATEYPVEQGADFTDHIRELPDEITLECIVSDTPSGDIATDPTRQAEPGPDGVTPLPSADALAKLRELKALRKPVTIETTLGTFTSMAFVDLTVPVDATKSPGKANPDPQKARSGALFFTAKFKKSTIVTNKRTKVRVRTPMAGAGGKPAVKAVVGKVAVIDTTVLWQHDIAKGQFRGIVSTVEIHYNRPAGASRDEVLAGGAAAPDAAFIEYFDAGSATPITGDRRQDLVADLAKQAELSQPKILDEGPNAQLRRFRNTPADVHLERFQQPAPETFPVAPLNADDLSKFQRTFPPTFPGP